MFFSSRARRVRGSGAGQGHIQRLGALSLTEEPPCFLHTAEGRRKNNHAAGRRRDPEDDLQKRGGGSRANLEGCEGGGQFLAGRVIPPSSKNQGCSRLRLSYYRPNSRGVEKSEIPGRVDRHVWLRLSGCQTMWSHHRHVPPVAVGHAWPSMPILMINKCRGGLPAEHSSGITTAAAAAAAQGQLGRAHGGVERETGTQLRPV